MTEKGLKRWRLGSIQAFELGVSAHKHSSVTPKMLNICTHYTGRESERVAGASFGFSHGPRHSLFSRGVQIKVGTEMSRKQVKFFFLTI